MSNQYREIEKALTKPVKLSDFVDVTKKEYKNVPNKKGLYAFWFSNHDQIVSKLNLSYSIKGNNEEHSVKIGWNINESMICVYIGKTNNFKKRLAQHLLLGTSTLLIDKAPYRYRKTTACQLRSGFDMLYRDKKNIDILNELDQRIHLSFFEKEDFINRFYAEDYFIGKFQPWFNLDSER